MVFNFLLFLKTRNFISAILNNKIETSIEIIVIVALANIAMIFNFAVILKIIKPMQDDSAVIKISFPRVFKNSNEMSSRFLSIMIFIIDDVVDIKAYPTIREYVPIYFGRK